ncbi:hypothetical protein [Faecalitalea cylindroides]|uniref:hypothetical protein n=1 Tax=Faecalitalea cylindroides TaxID=39483 RepID=UPI00195CBFAE|nr:hypothetical protein [Faecalitalea cylindroides]MBM6652173.1 hypothetical protein [Faecalitalea cylindroides]
MKSYESQIRRLKRNHRETRDLEDPLETISRIKKEDRLIPCITFVIYYGQEEWEEEISKQARNEGRLEGERRGEKRGERKQILQFIQEMLEKGYTDEMILGFKSVTKQLLKQAKLSH